MSKTLLEHAIGHAEEGFCVFPLKVGTKDKPMLKWRRASTIDLETVNEWWEKWPDSNIGIDTGKSGLAVLDVDMKDGKNGQRSLDKLTLENDELPETLIASTPTGGKHYIFKTNEKVANVQDGRMGEGLDVRGEGGYIVAPGSVVDAGEYKWFLDGIDIAEMPKWLVDLCGRSNTERQAAEVVPNLDETFAQRRAIAYLLEHAPEAIQGQAGDSTTFKVACELKDMGLRAEETLTLMLAHYNIQKCVPPWDLADLAVKVNSAYSSGQNPVGASAPEADFTPINPDSILTKTLADCKVIQKAAKTMLFGHRVSDVNLVDLPSRNWVLPGRLIEDYITLTVAPGGTGKSLFTLLECLAVATGKNLTGVEPAKSGPVFIYNLEDPLDELYRRIVATCALNNLPMKESLKNVYVQSGLDRPLFLAGMERSSPRKGRDCKRLEEYIGDMGFVVVCIDPLVRAHRLPENDNMAIDFLMDEISRIAKRTNTAISLVHHTAKNRSSEQLAGNIDYSRGAGAFINAARIASTITTMDEPTAKRLHIDDATRRSFLRLDAAKTNLTEADGRIRWFRKRGFNLVNGDNVGGVVASDLVQFELDVETREEQEIVELAAMLEGFVHDKPKTTNACAEYLTVTAPHLYGTKHRTNIARRIEGTLANGVVVGDRCVQFFKEQKGRSSNWVRSTKVEKKDD